LLEKEFDELLAYLIQQEEPKGDQIARRPKKHGLQPGMVAPSSDTCSHCKLAEPAVPRVRLDRGNSAALLGMDG